MIDFISLFVSEQQEKDIKKEISEGINLLPFSYLNVESHDLKNKKKVMTENYNKYNKLMFDKEKTMFEKKESLKNAMSKTKFFYNLLHNFNNTSYNEQAKYREKKRMIKNFFENIHNCPINITDYLSIYSSSYGVNENCTNPNLKESNDFTKENRINKIVEEIGNTRKKTKKSKRVKKREDPIETMSVKVSPFPFKTKEECKEKATSKPTFVSKPDMIRTMERLGYGDKSKKPLTSYTKDELCNLYFT